MKIWVLSDVHVELTTGWALPGSAARPDFHVPDGESDMAEHLQSYRRNTCLAANLRVLADDLDRISAGIGPTEADLARAPILFNWEPKLTPTHEPAIRGVVRGHPAIPDGEVLRAEILAVDPDLSWIRTWTGFFRLAESSVQFA